MNFCLSCIKHILRKAECLKAFLGKKIRLCVSKCFITSLISHCCQNARNAEKSQMKNKITDQNEVADKLDF